MSHMRSTIFVDICLVLCLAFVEQCRSTPEVRLLSPTEQLYNQSLDPYDATASRRRYVIDSTYMAKTPSYEIRVSYLGSPPASYSLSLLRVPVSRILPLLRDDDRKKIAFGLSSGVSPSLQRQLLDTERTIIHFENVESLPLECDDCDDATETVAVVEVAASPWGRRRDGVVRLPPGQDLVYFNIKMDPIILGLPSTMLPVVVAGLVVSLAALFCCTPIVLRIIQPVASRSPRFKRN